MKKNRLLYVICLLLASSLPGLLFHGQAQGTELYRLPLDDASSLDTTIATDPVVKEEGGGSIRITTAWPTVICLGEIPGIQIENVQIIYRARVRSEKLEGTAFLEMWCQVDGGLYFSRGMESVVSGTMDWKTLQTPFSLKEGQRATKVILNIVINGKGTVWVDDLRLMRETLK